MQSVETLLYEIFRSPMKAYMTVKRLKARYVALMDKVEMIAREGLLQTPDLFLLKHYTNGEGFTKPLLLGPSSRLRDSYEMRSLTIESILSRDHSLKKRSPIRLRNPSKLIDVTAVASFYLRLNSLDYPLKVDFPASISGSIKSSLT